MKESSPDGRLLAARAIQLVVRRAIPLERETLIFTVASALDVIMTWLLLTYEAPHGRTWFVESNPIARYLLYSWGFDALIYFKFSMVAFVAVICQVIARHRLELARKLLNVATVVVSGVVIYSLVLLLRNA